MDKLHKHQTPKLAHQSYNHSSHTHPKIGRRLGQSMYWNVINPSPHADRVHSEPESRLELSDDSKWWLTQMGGSRSMTKGFILLASTTVSGNQRSPPHHSKWHNHGPSFLFGDSHAARRQYDTTAQ